jgi:hypothetical protein
MVRLAKVVLICSKNFFDLRLLVKIQCEFNLTNGLDMKQCDKMI